MTENMSITSYQIEEPEWDGDDLIGVLKVEFSGGEVSYIKSTAIVLAEVVKSIGLDAAKERIAAKHDHVLESLRRGEMPW